MSRHQEFELPVRLSREEQAEKNRAEFPECSVLVDEMKALFGDVVVLAMTEGDKEIKPKNYQSDNDYPMWISSDRYFELSKLNQKAHEAANGKVKNGNSK